MNKFQQLVIAAACGLDSDHELVKDALGKGASKDAVKSGTTIPLKDLMSKTGVGTSIFSYKEVWENIDKLAEICPDLTGTALLEEDASGRSPADQAQELDLEGKIFYPPLWKDSKNDFEEAWYIYGEEKDYDAYLDVKREIAKLNGETLREDQLAAMDITYDDIADAVSDGEYEELNEKFAKGKDHLRADDLLLTRFGNHMLDNRVQWNYIERLWDELEAHGEKMDIDHFLFKVGANQSPLEFAAGVNISSKIFNEKLWAGRLDRMLDLYDIARKILPERSFENIDIVKPLKKLSAVLFEDMMKGDKSLTKRKLMTGLHRPVKDKNGELFTTTPLALEETWLIMDEVREALAEKKQKLSLTDLRETSGPNKEPYLMVAARTGNFAEAVNIIKEDKGVLSVDDLTKTYGEGKSTILDILVDRDELELVLDPLLWVGNEEQLFDVWYEIPEANRLEHDISDIVGQLTVFRLRNHFANKASGQAPKKPANDTGPENDKNGSKDGPKEDPKDNKDNKGPRLNFG